MGWRTAQHPTRDHSVPTRGCGAYGTEINTDRKDRWEERASSARDDTACPYPSPTAKTP